jgi:hypothetical protein
MCSLQCLVISCVQGTLPEFRLYHTLKVLRHVLLRAKTGVQKIMWFTVLENVSLTKIGKYMNNV